MAVVCSAAAIGIEWAYWRDANSARARFERASDQITATVARGLVAPVYMGRVDGLLDGRTDLDSAALARLGGTLPSNGLISGLALTTADANSAVVRASMPQSAPGLPIGRDLGALPTVRPALDLARDDGDAVVAQPHAGDFPGDGALIAYPEYGSGPPPATTAERRSRIQGYFVGIIDPKAVVQSSLTPEALRITAVNVSDGPFLFYASSSASAPRHAVVARPVTIANRTWTVTAWAGRGAIPSRPPGWAVAVAIAALVLSLGITIDLFRRATRTLAARETERARELRLIADAGPLLQQSLDLGELLPDFVVQLAEQFDLDRVGVAVANEEGELVDTFSMGPAVAAGRSIASVRPATMELAAGQDFVIPLQRTGRTVGALRARSRRSLELSQLDSIRAVADLLAAALGNAQLYQREQETVARLRDLDRLKLSFLSTVSHELRTAVAAIEGFGSLLVEHWPNLSDDQRREFIDRIARNAGSLKRLVDDLLDFARLERHALTVAPRLVSLSELAQQTVDQLASLFEQHELVLHITPDVVAFTDPDAVERILGNFLSNAAKYSPPESAVTVTVEHYGGRARLSVADQGPGIPPEERTRIFTRFYRSETDATQRTRGAGIGLAIVKEFADRLNAAIAVESAEGGGSRFVVLFPTEPSDLLDDGMASRAVADLVE